MHNHCKILRNNKAGFSFIELITVIAIIMIMTATAFVFLGGGRKKTDLKTAEREVAATIKLTQSYTLQGKTVSGSTPCGFGFRFKDDNSYEIFYILPGPDSSNNCSIKNANSDSRKCLGNSYCHILESYELKTGIKLQEEPSIATVYFTVPHANPFNSSGNAFSERSFYLLGANSEKKKITIDSGGSVIEE